MDTTNLSCDIGHKKSPGKPGPQPSTCDIRLRARAHRLEQRDTDDRHIDRRLQFLEKLPQTVCKYLRQGHSAVQACELTSTHTEVALATVQAHWRRFLTEKSEVSMAQRNRLIMDLAALGLTNALIGDRVGLHANSVSRIISAEKKRRLVWDRTPEPSAQLAPSAPAMPESVPVKSDDATGSIVVTGDRIPHRRNLRCVPDPIAISGGARSTPFPAMAAAIVNSGDAAG